MLFLSVIEPIDALNSNVLRIFGGLRWMKFQNLGGYLWRAHQISPCISREKCFLATTESCHIHNFKACNIFQILLLQTNGFKTIKTSMSDAAGDVT